MRAARRGSLLIKDDVQSVASTPHGRIIAFTRSINRVCGNSDHCCIERNIKHHGFGGRGFSFPGTFKQSLFRDNGSACGLCHRNAISDYRPLAVTVFEKPTRGAIGG
jgi:hypothetical protein